MKDLKLQVTSVPFFIPNFNLVCWELYNLTSLSLALYNCVLFISLMQSVIGVQILNTTFLFVLFGVAAVTVFGIVIVPLTCFMHHISHINATSALNFKFNWTIGVNCSM